MSCPLYGRIWDTGILGYQVSLTSDYFQAEDFYSLNEDVVAEQAEIAEAAAAAAGEPSNELASYSLPDQGLLASGVLPPPPPPKLQLPARANRRGPKSNR